MLTCIRSKRQRDAAEYALRTIQVELSGTFCMGKCQNGVCVKVNDELFSLTPDQVNEFFEKNVVEKLK